MTELLEAVDRLTSDLKKAAITLSADEARFLVDAYYQIQEDRIRSGAQIRELTESGEPHSVIQWLESQSTVLENNIKRALDSYSASNKVGSWSREVVGIGPVIAAGLLAHIDIEKAPTVGHIWRFAGLDPTSKWEKGGKRPWNARLKTLCWKIGESFVKVSGNPKALYGQLYVQRKAYEVAKNDSGAYADQAAALVNASPKHAQVETYKTGKLPAGHLHSRAKRYAVKQFLSDWHAAAFVERYGKEPPKPYPIAILGHAHLRGPEVVIAAN